MKKYSVNFTCTFTVLASNPEEAKTEGDRHLKEALLDDLLETEDFAIEIEEMP